MKSSLKQLLAFLLVTWTVYTASGQDLVIKNPSVSFGTISPGESIGVSSVIYNLGSKSASSSNVGYYLSANTVYDTSDVFLGSSQGSELAALSYDYRQATLHIPVGTHVGTYYIIYYADYSKIVSETKEVNNFNLVPIKIVNSSVDYIIKNKSVSADSVAAGASIYVTTLIYNQGSTTGRSSNLGYYLSSDSVWNESDLLLGFTLGYAINPRDSSYNNQYLIIPDSIPVGNYYLILKADYLNEVLETNEKNNLAKIKIVVDAPSIDLVVKNPSTYSTTAIAGNSLYLSSYVYNNGNSTSNSSDVGYYFSSDSIWDASDAFIGYFQGYFLYPGSGNYYSSYGLIPDSITEGTYYILFKADYLNNESEINENNNVASLKIKIILPAIDLVVQYPTISSTNVSSGGNINVTSSIYNIGNVNSSSSDVGYYLSKDSTWDVSDTYLGYSSGYGLYPGSSSYNYSYVTIPESTPVGKYYILFKADYLNNESEANESNNVANLPISITLPSVDLAIQYQYISGNSVSAGDYIYLSSYVVNIGNTYANSSDEGYYLSKDTTWDSSDAFLGYYPGSGLNPGSSSYNTAYVTIPANTKAGAYYLLFKADYQDKEVETNEKNNTVNLAINVDIPSIDFVVSYTNAYPTNAVAGGSVHLNSSVYNIGNSISDSSQLGYYLSSDSLLDASDSFLGSYSGYKLYPGNYFYSDSYVTIPDNTPVGDYYIIFKADYLNNNSEINEANNVVPVLINIVKPSIDLIILPSPTVSLDLIPSGGSVFITSLVFNQGSSYSNSSDVGYYFSSDSLFDSSDIFLGADSGIGLNTGENSYHGSSITIPSAPVGTYYIVFKADYLNKVSEANEKNNIATAVIKIGANDVNTDLSVQFQQVSPIVTSPGNYLFTSAEIINRSFAPAYNVNIGYYLSKDSTFGSSDIYLGNNFIPYIDSTQNVPINAGFYIPWQTALGVYYILTYVDNENLISETNETNNISSSLLYVSRLTSVNEADLLTSKVEVYPNPSAGNFTVKFNGEKTSGNVTVSINNLMGDEVFVKNISLSNLEINVITDSLPQGVYMMKLETEGKVIYKKIEIL